MMSESTKNPPQVQLNPRGIPKAPFVTKVEDFVPPGEVESTIGKFQEMISKYKYMEINLLGRRKSLETKIPDIQKTLDMVCYLMEKKYDFIGFPCLGVLNMRNQAAKDAGEDDTPIKTQFELSDAVWAAASIEPTGKVGLWLGANVMLEYTVEEAKELLTSKLESAQISMSQVMEDLEFLREQITTMEVNTARVYNHDVKTRRSVKA